MRCIINFGKNVLYRGSCILPHYISVSGLLERCQNCNMRRPRFNAANTKAHHWTRSSSNSIHITSFSLRYTLLLSSSHFLSFPSQCFARSFPTENAFVALSILRTCSIYLTLFYFNTRWPIYANQEVIRYVISQTFYIL
jgi:hypothetical protein